MLQLKTLKVSIKLSRHALSITVLALVAACSSNGEPFVISDEGHEIRVGGDLTDTKSLTREVQQKLKNNGQTSMARIEVSSPSHDTIRLAGFVDNDAVRQEAERLAYQVDGVRFVVNTLYLQR